MTRDLNLRPMPVDAQPVEPLTAAGQALDLAWPVGYMDRLAWRETIVEIEQEALDAARAGDGLRALFVAYFEKHGPGDDDEWCMKHLPTIQQVRLAVEGSER